MSDGLGIELLSLEGLIEESEIFDEPLSNRGNLLDGLWTQEVAGSGVGSQKDGEFQAKHVVGQSAELASQLVVDRRIKEQLSHGVKGHVFLVGR